MSISRLSILGVALLIGGWLAFDGSRAFIVGDYLTARNGPRAGQLGPWSHVVSALGLQPRSPVVKCLHVCLGLLWLLGLVCFILRPGLGWWMLLISSVGTLWYLPIGTVLSLIELALLFSPHVRLLK